MKVRLIVDVDVDVAALVEDNPPESIALSLGSEIETHLDSLRKVFGVRHVVVAPAADADRAE